VGVTGQQGDSSTLTAGCNGQQQAPAEPCPSQEHLDEVTCLQQLYPGVVHRHSLLPSSGAAGLEGLQQLGAGTAVGGRLAGYAAAQLVAAWAWSSSGLQGAVEGWAAQQMAVDAGNHHQQQQQQQQGGQEMWDGNSTTAAAASTFKAGVLRVGSSQAAQVALARGALGDPAALLPVVEEGGRVVGWVADLEAAAAAADLELLA
jgi:hypothetical protein